MSRRSGGGGRAARRSIGWVLVLALLAACERHEAPSPLSPRGSEAAAGLHPQLPDGGISASRSLLESAASSTTLTTFEASVTSAATRRVLILADRDGESTNALANALAAAGHQVTVRPAPEYTWDGTNPSLADFDVVVHLNGNTYSLGLPESAQSALLAFVRNGGGFIGSQWNGFELVQGRQLGMADLVLQRWANASSNNCGGCNITYTAVAEQAAHPVLAGVPTPFTFFADGHDAGDQVEFSSNPSTVLMRAPAGGPAVLVRELGRGRVVNFSHAANYLHSPPRTLHDPNIQRLYVNSVAWSSAGANQPPVITSVGGNNPDGAGYLADKGASITFTAAATDAEKSPLTFTWDFGDGTSAQATTAGGTEAQTASATHAYAENGEYPVTLRVTDSGGATAEGSTAAAIGHEVVVTVRYFGVLQPGMVVTATRTTGTDGTGEYHVQQTDANGQTSFRLSDAGWLFHARNLEDAGPNQDPEGDQSFLLAVAPNPDGLRSLSTTEDKDRVGALYDHRVPTSVALTPESYEDLTLNPYLLSGDGSFEPRAITITEPNAGTTTQGMIRSSLTQSSSGTLRCTLLDENGRPVTVLPPSTTDQRENAFVILPHRDGARLPPRPGGAPGFGLQRGILFGAGTFSNTDGTCAIRGIPNTTSFADAPLLETNVVKVQTESGSTQSVVFVKPFESSGTGETRIAPIAEPPRSFVDYIKDAWGDNRGKGDIGMVSYGWIARLDAQGNVVREGGEVVRSDVFSPAAHLRGDSRYTIHLRYWKDGYQVGQEQSIRMTVAWDALRKKWVVVERTPNKLPTGVVVHDPTGFAEPNAQGVLEGTVIWRFTLPGVPEDALELRVEAGTNEDRAPDRGFQRVLPGQYTWDTFGEE